MPTHDLGTRAARGIVVSVAGQGLRIGIQVLSVLLLARLLAPGDYGLLAMVVAVIGVAEVFRDLGLTTAAIRARQLSAAQRTNLFWISTALGAVLSTAAFLAAPLVAALFDRTELEDMTRALAWVFVLSGVAAQYRADLTRRMRFGVLALADVLAPLAGLGVALALALGGAGYWALVTQQLVQYGVMTVAVVVAGRWLPGRPSRRTPMDDLLRFGAGLVGIELIGYAGRNADSLLIGARFGATDLGLYNRVHQLLMVPLGQLRVPTTQVALPVLGRLQDDERRWAEFVRRGQLALGYTLVAGLGIVVGTAGPVVAVFLGDRWTETVPLLRWLAVGGACQTLAFVGYWVYLSRGLTGALTRFSLFETGVRLVAIAVGSAWGVVGLAAGFALAPALTWPISLWWLSRLAPIPRAQLVAGALRVLTVTGVVAAASAGVTALLGDAPAPLVLVLAAGAGAAAYLAITVWGPFRADLREVRSAVREGLRGRRAPAPEPGSSPDPGAVAAVPAAAGLPVAASSVAGAGEASCPAR
ncbi:lipopolysaccharide biosynthesis protein [Blastococcus sp. TF02A-26]|uniref:lipopolysaccharide biosynthesis protein n=1 Tax=Blastococcus sp. TF02A-26 TaxID=2250577 RepID=UPI000DEA9D86|nr:lipopolysaccharide biosynthesis protein [Blastococcus sp. TF02A-26]RBY86140.1 lipopolysaccharide biosynthesis protein [Blastococcus sp. TF02A-26]